jgi:hypothetical protein
MTGSDEKPQLGTGSFIDSQPTDDSLAFSVLSDEPIVGISERVLTLPGEPNVATQALEQELKEKHFLLPTQRGGKGQLSSLIDRLRRRRLVEVIGQRDVSLEILGFHVPPGGAGAFDMSAKSSGGAKASLIALGNGFGNGRRICVGMRNKVATRATCARIVQHILLEVSRYEIDGERGMPVLRSDVIGVGHQELVSWPDCPYCAANKGDIDRLTFDVDESRSVDLRNFDDTLHREETLEICEDRGADIGVGLSISAIGTLSAGVHYECSVEASCLIEYDFPPRREYWAFRRRGERTSPPFWWTK